MSAIVVEGTSEPHATADWHPVPVFEVDDSLEQYLWVVAVSCQNTGEGPTCAAWVRDTEGRVSVGAGGTGSWSASNLVPLVHESGLEYKVENNNGDATTAFRLEIKVGQVSAPYNNDE